MSNPLVWFILTPISMICLYAAWNNHEWLYRGRGLLWVGLFGREGARIALMITYMLLAVVGTFIILTSGR